MNRAMKSEIISYSQSTKTIERYTSNYDTPLVGLIRWCLSGRRETLFEDGVGRDFVDFRDLNKNHV